LKKLSLSVTDNIDYHGFAIVSPEKDYRLCFEINKAMGYALEKSKTLVVIDSKIKTANEFSAFFYDDPDNKCSHYVVKNLQDNARLLPSMKEADYIYIVSGNIKLKTLHEIKTSFATIRNIQSIFVLKNEYIKHINLD